MTRAGTARAEGSNPTARLGLQRAPGTVPSYTAGPR